MKPGGGVAYATVTLLRGDRQAAGGATDAEGRFRLTADTGRYLLSLRHVGYEPLERPLHLGPPGTRPRGTPPHGGPESGP